MQATIFSPISCTGVGIHFGRQTIMTLRPSDEGCGIIFKRTDVENSENNIRAHYQNVQKSYYGTVIYNASEVFVSTIEHLMAALSAIGITNLVVEIDGPEVPIMDGGSEQFCFMIKSAGVRIQDAKRKTLKIIREVIVRHNDSYVIARPTQNLQYNVNYVIDFGLSAIGRQELAYTDNCVDFCNQIAPAKTFGNMADIEKLKTIGMGLGGSLQNTIVIDSNGDKILNSRHLYCKNDFVKHKILDFIGDIYLAESYILAGFECYKSGHTLNNLLLKEIFSDSGNYEYI